MKSHVIQKTVWLRVLSAALSVTLSFTFIPKLLETTAVRAAWSKNTENTRIGVNLIANPTAPESKDDPWSGSYIYFGKFRGEPMKYRVLDKNSDKYYAGGNTLFLDSDLILFDTRFDNDGRTNSGANDSNEWAYSDARESLNGTRFLNGDGVFTSIEKASIVPSTTSSHIRMSGTLMDSWFRNYIGLSGDYVFLLDLSDVMNPSYGYSSDCGVDSNENTYKVKNRIKESCDALGGGYDYWMLRSASYKGYVGQIAADGYADNFPDNVVNGVAPAFNINLESILFCSLVFGHYGRAGAEYKLTLLDSKMTAKIPNGAVVTDLGNNTYSLPYRISGSDASMADQLSVLVTDKLFDEKGAKILYYEKISGSSLTTSGTVNLTLPSTLSGEWGEDYHVYVLAEDINGEHETDYASAPQEIYKPVATYDLRAPLVLSDVQDYLLVVAASTDVINYQRISSDVSLLDVNKDGTYDLQYKYDDTIQAIVLSVMEECTLTDTYTIDMSKVFNNPYHLQKYEFIFPAAPVSYTITVKTDGHGIASASATSGFTGDSITLYATPNEGYQFKQWQVVSGGVTISKNAFVIGTENVVIKAIFKSVATTPTPDPVTPEPDPVTPDPVPVTPDPDPLPDPVPVTPDPVPATPEPDPTTPIPDPDPVDPQPDPVDPQPVKDPSFEEFIDRLYLYALLREPEADGKAFWMNKVLNEGFTGGRCAYGFLVEAPEFLNRDLTNEQFIDTLYQIFFDRAADESGKAFWLSKLAEGMTRAEMVNGFIDSTEWCNLCAYYGVKSGAPNAKAEKASNNAIKFATRLYTECLGRDYDADGLQFWALRLTNLESSGYEAALGFFTSEEFKNQNLSDDEFIHRLYRTFMGRDEDADGFAFWKSHLGVDMTREDLIRGFAQSQEFTNICNQYGIDKGI